MYLLSWLLASSTTIIAYSTGTYSVNGFLISCHTWVAVALLLLLLFKIVHNYKCKWTTKNEYKRNEKLVTIEKMNQNMDVCQREHITRQSHFTVSHLHQVLDLLDLMPWWCRVNIRQQLIHGFPPHLSVLCHLDSIVELHMHFFAVLLHCMHPPFLLPAIPPCSLHLPIECHVCISLCSFSQHDQNT